MKCLRHYTFIGIVFVLIAGTFSHFLYEWTQNNHIVGFITPTYEAIILPYVDIFIYNDFEIPQKIFVYYFCFMFWNFNRHISNSTFLLCLYFNTR